MRPDIQGAPRRLTGAEALAIYDLLIEAGARDSDDERNAFVQYAIDDLHIEWRFQGSLGFGGKLYFDGYAVPRIGCYPEDETPARRATIAYVNARLPDLFDRVATNPGAPDA